MRKKLFGNLAVRSNKRNYDSSYLTGNNLINQDTRIYQANYTNLMNNPFIQPIINYFTTILLDHEIEVMINNKVMKNKQLNKMLNIKPNNKVNYKNYIESIVTDLVINGESYVGITRNKNLQPIELNNIQRELVTVIAEEPTRENGYSKDYRYYVNGAEVEKQDLLHFTLTSCKQKFGSGISNETFLKNISERLEEIANAKSLSAYNISKNTYFMKLPQKSNDFTLEKRKALADEAVLLLQSMTGDFNKILTLSSDLNLEYQQFEKTSAEIINLEKSTLMELCTRYGVPLSIYNLELVNTAENSEEDVENIAVTNFKNSLAYELSDKLIITDTEIVSINFKEKEGKQKKEIEEDNNDK